MLNTKIFIFFLTISICGLLAAQDTLYLYRGGVVIKKRAVADIDSMIFYKAAAIPHDSITDNESNIYLIIIIGTQVWMAENLKSTKYNDGTAIPLITSNTLWAGANSQDIVGLNNDALINKNKYGALYNWYTINTGKLCPVGWHIPDETEFGDLINFLGGTDYAGGR